MDNSNRTFFQLQQRQEQTLSPQQIQSIAVLQMNTQELLHHIDEVLLENPLLESESNETAQEELQHLLQDTGWGAVPRHVASTESVQPYYGGRTDPDIDGLPSFLTDQLSRQHLSNALLRCCVCLVALLDDNGYLSPEEWDSFREMFPNETALSALREVQKLEPAGVGARTLSECLCLQLKRKYPEENIAFLIAQSHLNALASQHYRAIARSLQVPEAAVRHAAKIIAALDPHPGQEFASAEMVAYVRPDVYIMQVDGTLQVLLNDANLPRLSLDSYYTNLLQTTEDEEARSYLRQKQQQAKQLISNIERRSKTLRRCSEVILRLQSDFFAGFTQELVPVTAQHLASELGMHPSTISRTIQGKYLQCAQGTYPLRYFFNTSLPDGRTSRQAVCRRILDIIAQEDAAHPLSDPSIQKKLAESNIHVSRRAVTKYRAELKIPPMSRRRKNIL